MKKNKTKNICQLCRSLYITHNKNYPYGCRAFNFISKKQPFLEVYNSSGMKCALFSYKKKNDILNNKNKKKGRLA